MTNAKTAIHFQQFFIQFFLRICIERCLYINFLFMIAHMLLLNISRKLQPKNNRSLVRVDCFHWILRRQWIFSRTNFRCHRSIGTTVSSTVLVCNTCIKVHLRIGEYIYLKCWSTWSIDLQNYSYESWNNECELFYFLT